MSYEIWFEKHAKKHKQIVSKLLKNNYTKDEIIKYFDFENMSKKERDFCPLYAKDQKCHDIQELNCYLCACPNFRFNDDGISYDGKYKTLSKCEINNGEDFIGKDVIHHDCSSCSVPHLKDYVKSNYNEDWKEIMKNCNLGLNN